jgi:2-keto-4-pentenoate hydratase/2-oxohepta-3-ene-1,7-dioic acid hydratase in catechol pathway
MVVAGSDDSGTVSVGGKTYAVTDVDVLPRAEPSKIVYAGLNYEDHLDKRDEPRPERPRLFVNTPNTAAGHGDSIRLPPEKDLIEYEGEPAVVIGEQCRHVPAADALSVPAGYTCSDDLSNRDDQLPRQNFVRAKRFDWALQLGPVLVPQCRPATSATPTPVPSGTLICATAERRATRWTST